jgi:hypothetical protein
MCNARTEGNYRLSGAWCEQEQGKRHCQECSIMRDTEAQKRIAELKDICITEEQFRKCLSDMCAEMLKPQNILEHNAKRLL